MIALRQGLFVGVQLYPLGAPGLPHIPSQVAPAPADKAVIGPIPVTPVWRVYITTPVESRVYCV